MRVKGEGGECYVVNSNPNPWRKNPPPKSLAMSKLYIFSFRRKLNFFPVTQIWVASFLLNVKIFFMSTTAPAVAAAMGSPRSPPWARRHLEH